MVAIDLNGKNGLVLGVTNQRSIAWAMLFSKKRILIELLKHIKKQLKSILVAMKPIVI